MSRSRYGIKLLGLCALALGLTAIGAGTAQAEVGSHWNVAGKSIPSGLLPFVQVKEIEELKSAEAGKHLVLLTKLLGGIPFHILCTGMQLIEFHLLTEGGSLGKIRFSGCKTLLGEKASPACNPKEGILETMLLKDLIVLHKLESGVIDTLDRLEPNAGTTFINFETSPECSVGKKIPVGGVIFLKDCQNAFGTEQVDHLFEQGPLTHLWVLSDTVEHAATIDGSVVLGLINVGTEKHEGLKWSGTAA
jgi:hypothetical protein